MAVSLRASQAAGGQGPGTADSRQQNGQVQVEAQGCVRSANLGRARLDVVLGRECNASKPSSAVFFGLRRLPVGKGRCFEAEGGDNSVR